MSDMFSPIALNGTTGKVRKLKGKLTAADGKPGEDGGYYMPSVDESGVLSWAASKEDMPPVPTANIQGEKGDAGEDGRNGANGKDGITPKLQKSSTAIQVSYDGGSEYEDLVQLSELKGPQGDRGLQGPQGNDGAPGENGAAGKDGSPGKNGEDGGYYTPSVSEAGLLTWEASKEGMPPVGSTNIKGADGTPGKDGAAGKNGEDGGYYTPSVSGAGLLTWTASKTGMASVPGVNIKGADGAAGPKGNDGAAGKDGTTPKLQKTSTAIQVSYDGGSEYEDLVLLSEITGPKGADGAAGTKGADGKTPVRGTDYWTEDDIATIKGYVDDAIINGKW